jgi:hypothetical protein
LRQNRPRKLRMQEVYVKFYHNQLQTKKWSLPLMVFDKFCEAGFLSYFRAALNTSTWIPLVAPFSSQQLLSVFRYLYFLFIIIRQWPWILGSEY